MCDTIFATPAATAERNMLFGSPGGRPLTLGSEAPSEMTSEP